MVTKNFWNTFSWFFICWSTKTIHIDVLSTSTYDYVHLYFYVYFFQKYNYEKNVSMYLIFLPILSLLFTTSFLSEGIWKIFSYFQAIAKLHLVPCQISIIFLKIVKYKTFHYRLFDRILNIPPNSCRLTSSFLLFEKLCNIKNEWITPGNSSNLIFRRV